jgi:hypothetical protein
MKPLGSFGLALPLLALGAAACSDNNGPGNPVTYKKLTVLADFESGDVLNPDPRWSGVFEKSGDLAAGGNSPVPDAFSAQGEKLSPPRVSPDGMTVSTKAYHAHDDGEHTFWGTAWLCSLRNNRAVNLSEYSGMFLWARSDGLAGTTVKIGLSDLGSEANAKDEQMQPIAICDINDTRPTGGRGCYDDYSAKIYPDGQWRRYDIPFSSLTTGGWGYLHAFDPSMIFVLKFSVLPAVKYDVWIDDIVLYTR